MRVLRCVSARIDSFIVLAGPHLGQMWACDQMPMSLWRANPGSDLQKPLDQVIWPDTLFMEHPPAL